MNESGVKATPLRRRVEVLYDFEYTSAEGKHVVIRRREELTLVEETNDEWWKVCRYKTPFFVPANYVTAVDKPQVTARSSQRKSPASVSHSNGGLARASLYSGRAATWTNGRSSEGTAARTSLLAEGSATWAPGAGTLERASDYPSDHIDGLTKPRQRLLPGERSSFHATFTGSSNGAEMERRPRASTSSSDDSEAQEQGVGATAAAHAMLLQSYLLSPEQEVATSGYSKGPVINSIPDVTPLSSPDSDVCNNNIENKQAGPALSTTAEDTTPNLSTKEKRLAGMHSIKKGWTEAAESSGRKSYVHNASGERWLSSTDRGGRQYYYKENTDQSAWELPELLSNRDTEVELFRHNSQSDRVSSPPAMSAHTNQWLQSRPKSASNLFNLDLSSSQETPSLASCFSPEKSQLLSDTNVGNSGSRLKKFGAWQVTETLKRDMLQTCRLTESNRKSAKKNWEVLYVVATGMSLSFYKDEKSGRRTPDESPEALRPEAVLSLHSSKAHWTSIKTGKKNVLEVVCDNGTYLLQHDDPLVMQEWFILLNGKSPVLDHRDSPAEASQEQADEQGKQDVVWRSKGNRFRLPRGATYSVYGMQQVATVREKLKALLARRPSLKDLEEKGIIRENVFNSHLLFLCNREQRTVPKFVERCIAAIESKGLDAEGIYRVNPNASEMQSLRCEIDQNEYYNLSNWDIHVLAGTLKMFFRELREPLIPFDYYAMFLDVMRVDDAAQRLSSVRLLISSMLPANRDTLRVLMAHLLRVCAQSDKNKMQARNVAIVFGPTLMRPELDSTAALSQAHSQNSVVEYILLNFDKLF